VLACRGTGEPACVVTIALSNGRHAGDPSEGEA